jgi:hypothetical protein
MYWQWYVRTSDPGPGGSGPRLGRISGYVRDPGPGGSGPPWARDT